MNYSRYSPSYEDEYKMNARDWDRTPYQGFNKTVTMQNEVTPCALDNLQSSSPYRRDDSPYRRDLSSPYRREASPYSRSYSNQRDNTTLYTNNGPINRPVSRPSSPLPASRSYSRPASRPSSPLPASRPLSRPASPYRRACWDDPNANVNMRPASPYRGNYFNNLPRATDYNVKIGGSNLYGNTIMPYTRAHENATYLADAAKCVGHRQRYMTTYDSTHNIHSSVLGLPGYYGQDDALHTTCHFEPDHTLNRSHTAAHDRERDTAVWHNRNGFGRTSLELPVVSENPQVPVSNFAPPEDEIQQEFVLLHDIESQVADLREKLQHTLYNHY